MISNEFIENILHEFVQLKRAIPLDTKKLGKFKHNAHLCPKVKMQLENILSSYESINKLRMTYRASEIME